MFDVKPSSHMYAYTCKISPKLCIQNLMNLELVFMEILNQRRELVAAKKCWKYWTKTCLIISNILKILFITKFKLIRFHFVSQTERFGADLMRICQRIPQKLEVSIKIFTFDQSECREGIISSSRFVAMRMREISDGALSASNSGRSLFESVCYTWICLFNLHRELGMICLKRIVDVFSEMCLHSPAANHSRFVLP